MSNKNRLGMKLYNNNKTPRVIKFLITKRWHRKVILNEKNLRKKKNNTLFSINFDENEKIVFDLPVAYDSVALPIVNHQTFFEIEFLEEIRRNLIGESVIIDIGANIGNHSIYFSKMNINNTIYGFEPLAETYNMLKRNIELNHLSNVNIYNIALGDKVGYGEIELNGYKTHNLGLTKVKYSNKKDIRFDTLDNFVTKNHITGINLVKIDVEGFEAYVLEGMKDVIKKFNPYIWIEILKENEKKIFKQLANYELIMQDSNVFNRNENYLFKREK